MKTLIIIITMLFSSMGFANKNETIFKEIKNFSNLNTVLEKELLKQVNNPKDFKFILKKVVKGLSKVTYYHYNYTYKDILVDNQEVVISTKNNKPFLLSGIFTYPKINSLDTKYNETEVFQEFKKSVNSLKFHSDIKKVLIVKEQKTTINYKALVEYTDKNGYHLGVIYLNSSTKKISLFNSHIYDSLYREVYDFNNKCLLDYSDYWSLPKVCGGNSSCAGTLLFTEGDPDNNNDNDAINAYNNSGITYWFYKNMLNRDSFNNAGKPLVSTIHVRFGNNGFCYGGNASFMGSPFYQMLYGEGFSKALDVVAHELTHAVTDATSDLIYQDESGALNEAMSDIFGSTVEAWSNSGGSSIGNPTVFNYDNNTWKIGEDLGRVMRYMNTPNYLGDPDHYSLKIGGLQDNGGVHTNSSIINLAYYLIVAGGNHPRKIFQNIIPDVEGLGLTKAIKIFYEAQIGLFISSTDFSNARKLLSQAAENLYGTCSNESEQVNRAFDILGVPGARREECGSTCENLDCSHDVNSFCSEAFGQAYCNCNEGYHLNYDRTLCEEDYICYYVTCEMSNSHCEEYQNAGICVCDEGYYPDGQSCLKKELDPCSEITCDDHGLCENNSGTPVCICDSGYENANETSCVKYVNPCDNITCSGHGNCIVKNNQALCGCFDGYHAENLECIQDEVDLCENVTCSNHGTCSIANEAPICICENGYTSENLSCIQDNVISINPKKPAESCNYGSSNNPYLLFMMFGFFLIIIRKVIKSRNF